VAKLDKLNEEDPFDLILDLHATLRSFRLKCSFWTIPALTVDKRRWERFFLTSIKSKWLKRIFDHKIFGLTTQVERILKDFEWTFDDGRAISRTQEFRKGPHKELTSLEGLPEYNLPKPYIVLAPSASFAPKRWPIERFLEKIL
jgi:ADP-heptose:LPS heptosyltransferase